MKHIYKTPYGPSMSITEHRNGTATLAWWVGGSRKTKKYNSFRGAKIAMSRSCDGFYEEVKA